MRRRSAEKRKTTADPLYNSPVLGKFINILMINGKKSTASKIVYECLTILQEKFNEDPLKVFYKGLDNARPRMVVKSRRIGGATYQVPMEVDKDKGLSIAMHWMRDYVRAKKGRPMHVKLAEEVANTYKNEGPVIKKRDDTHKMAEANRAFAHFRF
ncbi:MAG: 30S ribosomal protein S7 [Candidatus Omnitrophica bacterium]|nr:30S ribosomal protein S7 [Candidatus Omnitrophota bacterium]